MGMIYAYRSGALANDADPVNTLTHWTGDWALWWLFVSLAVTPIRRLSPKLSNLIRFRRMLGLYAFFYATLHLSTYVFLFSGFDVQAAIAGVQAGHLGVIWTQLKAVWPTMLDDVLKRKFIQVGLFAWVVLLALALTSPTFMLRAMGGKNWQRLHSSGIRGGDCRVHSLLVDGEGGGEDAVEGLGGAGGAAWGAGVSGRCGTAGGRRRWRRCGWLDATSLAGRV